MKKLLILLFLVACQEDEPKGIYFHIYTVNAVIDDSDLEFNATTVYEAFRSRENKVTSYNEAVLLNDNPVEIEHETIYGTSKISQTGNSFNITINEETFVITPELTDNKYSFSGYVTGNYDSRLDIRFSLTVQ